MRRLLIVLALLCVPALALAQVYPANSYPAGAAETYLGLPVLTKSVTISAERSRTLFSNPLEFLPAKPGYAYFMLRCLHTHGAGVNHTTSGVTGYGLFYQQGSTPACRATLTPATFFPDRFGMATHQLSYTDYGMSTSATNSLALSSAVVVKTTGADLSGSGTYSMTTTASYVEVPVPGGTMVFNGAFTGSASGWTLGAGGGAPDWAYSANTVTHANGGGTAALQPSTPLAVVAGHQYEIEFTLSSVTGGSVTVSIGGTSGTARSSSATFVETLTATTTGNLLFTPSTTFAGTLDGITVVDSSAP